jgi:lipopolysaccharide/colanic/teichoic acid biosynthesis glycosyltransferase
VKLNSTYTLVKRITDIIVALVLLILTSPAFIIISILIRLCTPATIFFPQERMGVKGQTFVMLKFRSLQPDEANIPYAVLHQRGRIQYLKLWGWNLGGFLRKWRLDELPQLFQVLCGQMSMVGLRPALPNEAILTWRIENGFDSVPIGITGLYQTRGGKSLSLAQRQQLERQQCLQVSYLNDLRILYETIYAILFCRGAGE